jgi:thiamine-phosphate pyrophosphorylase
MKLIVITPSHDVENEHDLLGKMLDMGLPSLHVRKPKLSKANLKDYLNEFTKSQQRKIILHTDNSLFWNNDLKGIHVSKQQRKRKIKFFLFKAKLLFCRRNLAVGTSSGSLDSLDEAYNQFDYVMVSPIFINPHGHQPNFNPATLKRLIPHYPGKVIARGGATIDSINQAKEIGFSGIAFHQYIWNNPEPLETFRRIIDRFHELGLPIE